MKIISVYFFEGFMKTIKLAYFLGVFILLYSCGDNHRFDKNSSNIIMIENFQSLGSSVECIYRTCSDRYSVTFSDSSLVDFSKLEVEVVFITSIPESPFSSEEGDLLLYLHLKNSLDSFYVAPQDVLLTIDGTLPDFNSLSSLDSPSVSGRINFITEFERDLSKDGFGIVIFKQQDLEYSCDVVIEDVQCTL